MAVLEGGFRIAGSRSRRRRRFPPLLLASLLFGLVALASAQAPTAGFVYTQVGLDLCAVTESSEFEEVPPIDYFTSECPGFAGYRVFFRGGDLRTWLELEKGGVRSRFSEGRLGEHSPGSFPYLTGAPLEWRYRIEERSEVRTVVPYAVIYRVAGQDWEDHTRENQHLLVLRLSGVEACLLGSADTNEAARTLADDPKRGCP